MADQAEFRFDPENWERILNSIGAKWKDIEARRKFADIISPSVFADIMYHFEEEEGPKGRWKAWSKSYADHMAKRGKAGNKILQDSGRLKMSFKPTSWKARSEGLIFINKAKTKGGFPYAAAHDEGGPKLPQRRFMWLSSKGMRNIVNTVEGWLFSSTRE